MYIKKIGTRRTKNEKKIFLSEEEEEGWKSESEGVVGMGGSRDKGQREGIREKIRNRLSTPVTSSPSPSPSPQQGPPLLDFSPVTPGFYFLSLFPLLFTHHFLSFSSLSPNHRGLNVGNSRKRDFVMFSGQMYRPSHCYCLFVG